jgi:hypothetical protein
MRQPNQRQPEPDPPGGRAAARRDEFLAARFGPGGQPPGPTDPSGEAAAQEEPCEQQGEQPAAEDAPPKP